MQDPPNLLIVTCIRNLTLGDVLEGYLSVSFVRRRVTWIEISPQRKDQVQGKNIGQVSALDAKKAKGNTDLIVGMYHLNNHQCFVLFDCGATHSFISNQFVERLGPRAIPLTILMVVTTATDDVVETQWICENYFLWVNGQ